ncbi:hypothetical protein HPB50_012338 [Hyalomma asiaticum]|uniref:Uncharacterized protein n=1 Tax=Hyalomma asiaticum TaxID=266040 RepID=A0ACB7S5W7_HYAAI|nr:hypothetical protein HPB50_012338 [Hyalomma asiaticum]
MAHPPHVYFPQVYVIPVLMPVLLGVLLPLDVSPTAQLTLEPRDPPLKKENSLLLDLPPLVRRCFNRVKPDRQRHQTFKTTYTACVNRHFLVGTRAAATTWLIRLTFTFHSRREIRQHGFLRDLVSQFDSRDHVVELTFVTHIHAVYQPHTSIGISVLNVISSRPYLGRDSF